MPRRQNKPRHQNMPRERFIPRVLRFLWDLPANSNILLVSDFMEKVIFMYEVWQNLLWCAVKSAHGRVKDQG